MIEEERSHRMISHSEARDKYSLVGNREYLNEIDWERIKGLHPSLRTILNEEIRRGNKISETSAGWPTEHSLLVILKKPFHKKYKVDETEFRDINDPHYWKAEYVVSHAEHVLACRFQDNGIASAGPSSG